MRTTYHLREGTTWQDGTPLSAQDFVFAADVYRKPEFGAGASRLVRALDAVTAPDDRTLLIRYKAPYPNADDLTGTDGLPPLPRHVLQAGFDQGSAGLDRAGDLFAAQLAVGVQRDHGGRRLVAVSVLQGRLYLP